MKKLIFNFLLLYGLFYDVFAAKEPEFSITLESVGLCKNVRTRTDYISFNNFKLWPNYTTTGYIDILQDFPVTTAVKFRAFEQRNDTWVASPLSLDNLDFCQYLEKDMWFVPVARLVLNIPDHCPMRKSHLMFKGTMLFKRSRGILPFGCFKGQLILKDKDQLLACVDTVTKTAQYSKRHEHICIDP